MTLTPNLTPSSLDRHGLLPDSTDDTTRQTNSPDTNRMVTDTQSRLWHSEGQGAVEVAIGGAMTQFELRHSRT